MGDEGQTGPDDYFRRVARTFDAVAPAYDATFERQGGIMAALRRRSLDVLRRTLPKQGRVLEIGCGTGTEATALARSGRTVVATDISEAMLVQARRRASAAGVAGRVQFVQCAAHDVAGLTAAVSVDELTGAYSSFGALNCEPDLGLVAYGLASLLPPGAPLVLSVMNRWCLWELTWYLAHGQPGRAFRRLRPAGGGGEVGSQSAPGLAPSLGRLPVWYVTPGSLAQAFRPWFSVASVGALAVALPPPALDPWLARRPRLGRALAWLDDRLWDRSPFSWWGDHVIMVLHRTGAPAELRRDA